MAPLLKIREDRQANGTNGFSLLAVFQSQTARLGVSLRPFQTDHLAAPAPRQRDLANGVYLSESVNGRNHGSVLETDAKPEIYAVSPAKTCDEGCSWPIQQGLDRRHWCGYMNGTDFPKPSAKLSEKSL